MQCGNITTLTTEMNRSGAQLASVMQEPGVSLPERLRMATVHLESIGNNYGLLKTMLELMSTTADAPVSSSITSPPRRRHMSSSQVRRSLDSELADIQVDVVDGAPLPMLEAFGDECADDQDMTIGERLSRRYPLDLAKTDNLLRTLNNNLRELAQHSSHFYVANGAGVNLNLPIPFDIFHVFTNSFVHLDERFAPLSDAFVAVLEESIDSFRRSVSSADGIITFVKYVIKRMATDDIFGRYCFDALVETFQTLLEEPVDDGCDVHERLTFPRLVSMSLTCVSLWLEQILSLTSLPKNSIEYKRVRSDLLYFTFVDLPMALWGLFLIFFLLF